MTEKRYDEIMNLHYLWLETEGSKGEQAVFENWDFLAFHDWLAKTKIFARVIFTNCDFTYFEIEKARFVECDFYNCKLLWMTFTDCYFVDCNMDFNTKSCRKVDFYKHHNSYFTNN